MQQEAAIVRTGQRIDLLLVALGSECDGDKRLSLTARKERRTGCTWQNAKFAFDFTDICESTTIDSLTVV